MKIKMYLLLIAMCFAGVSGCSKKEPEATAKLGDKATLLEGLTYVKGDPVTFEQGKVYVIEFWATWCGPCKASMPHLTEVQKQYKDKGVTIISISNEELNIVKPFVTEQGDGMGYTVAVDTKGIVIDGYMAAFKQRGIPAAFIVDGNGNIAWVGHPMNKLEETLDQVISDTFDSAALSTQREEDKIKADAENTAN